MTPVLFAREDSIYKALGCDVWDFSRDAVKWPGGKSGIHHPPCRSWGQMSHFAKPRPGERWLAIWSIIQIRRHGGVLEHPRASRLWPAMNLPKPGTYDQYGGFSLCVNQSWWGHKAEKNTMLYIVGCKLEDLPEIPLSFNAIEYTVKSSVLLNSGKQAKKRLTAKECEATPPDFAKWLIQVAELCNNKNK